MSEEANEKVRLDIGCGMNPLDGWVPIDIKVGKQAYPLEYPDESVDEIRAVHILEHFDYWKTGEILSEWARVLKDGGLLRVAVPDFDKIIETYKGENEKREPIEQYIMGGQADEHDIHRAIFNADKLAGFLMKAGFGDIQRWQTTVGDCAALALSLNLQGTKGAPNPEVVKPPLSVAAVMSVPRLGFLDNFFCAFRALMPLKIPIHKFTGAFWGQCLERAICEVYPRHRPDAVLTIDYDSIYNPDDVETLIRLMIEHPEADAICGMQMSRGGCWPLFTKHGSNGKPTNQIPMTAFDPDLCDIATGHFGLTLIRMEKLRRMPHPWFKGEPNVYGEWGEGRIDADIYFWKKWAEMGYSLYQANRVPIGHGELMVMWPGFGLDTTVAKSLVDKLPALFDEEGKLLSEPPAEVVKEIRALMEDARTGKFQTLFQHPTDFWEKGKPEGIWK